MADGLLLPDGYTLKVCPKCEGKWPLSHFLSYKKPCRRCRADTLIAWRAGSPVKAKALSQAWHVENPDYAADRRAKNPEEIRQRDREAYRRRRIALGLPIRPDIGQRVTEDGRICTTCRKRQHETQFYRRRNGSISSLCRKCSSLATLEWGLRNPDKIRQKSKISQLRAYGLTQGTFDALLKKQSGRCSICVEKLILEQQKYAVDHCHSTKKVRGILCIKCNAGLGQFRDNEDYLIAAAEYLRRSRIEED